MSNALNRQALARRLRRLTHKQIVRFERSLTPRRRPKPSKQAKSAARENAAAQTRAYLQSKRAAPIRRRPQRRRRPWPASGGGAMATPLANDSNRRDRFRVAAARDPRYIVRRPR